MKILENPKLKHPLVLLLITAILTASGFLIKNYFFKGESNTSCSINTNNQIGGNNAVNCEPTSYGKPIEETFPYENFEHDKNWNVRLKLKYKPLPNTIAIYWGVVPIIHFSVVDKTLSIETSKIDTASLPFQDPGLQYNPITVKYLALP